MDKRIVVFDWGASSFFGWGIYGINLMLNWALRPDVEAISARQFRPEEVIVGPLEQKLLQPLFAASRTLNERRRAWPQPVMNVPTLVMHCLGNDLTYAADERLIIGKPTVGVIFSEDATLTAMGYERSKLYSLIVTGSTWGREILAANGVSHVQTVVQGVDTTLFHPAPKRGIFRDKFVVFSGGKLELRKSQDLVVEAFRIFASKHPDAVLLTAWCSPWPQFAAMLNDNPNLEPIRFNGTVPDTWRWTLENGIPREQTFHLGSIPQPSMAQVLREADVALFPNRAEGGTNLVAMECMACGVPAILSANTGHLDLIDDQNCYPLLRQEAIEGASRAGWGESNVDEMVAALELAYSNRRDAADRGQRGSDFISQWTWAAQMGQLADLLLPYLEVSAPAVISA
ncbi:MAG TPA: glycosyltransferase family 4 protein [Acidobacteriaceae bacterium]|jgi:glycosyltransferase involved in cell wall biosynthesis|nr:glycosyltransferase family 4 protein [Acidobacteriaceae bacterium]